MIAYGISSKIPHSFFHNLLVDIDSSSPICHVDASRYLRSKGIIPKLFYTPHGFHLVALHPFRFEELLLFMPTVPHIDMQWFKIGAERGYWFLITYEWFPFKNVQHMKLTFKDGANRWLNTKRPI